MAEKICLQWNDFQDDIKSLFWKLREDKDFTDVTLACEDGQQVEAHKVVLAASSPFFQNVLGSNKHPHLLIYMRGVNLIDLLAIVDFLYNGEANVFQENLDSFMALAEELQLKGLMGKNYDKHEKLEESYFEERSPASIERAQTPSNSNKQEMFWSKIPGKIPGTESKEIVAAVTQFSGVLEKLEANVRSMMEISQKLHANGTHRLHVCKVCGKEGTSSVIKKHVESNHLEGIVLPCNLCEKTLGSRRSLMHHMKLHKNI